MSRHMTIEKKKDTRNGILRMGITIAAVIIDILIILFLFTKLRDYAE